MADVSTWPADRKIGEAIKRSLSFMPRSVAAQAAVFIEPGTLAIISGTLAIWAGSHFFGVGEVVDVGLLLVGAFFIGTSIADISRDLLDFGVGAYRAKTDADLDNAARLFARVVVAAGVTAVLALLLRRSARGIQASRGASIADVVRPRQPGLLPAGPDPLPGSFYSNPAITGDASLAAGAGETGWFGEIRYSTAGSASDAQLARLHELVHRFLRPRLLPLRTFRARLAASAYWRSAVLQYVEEAMAETFAQLSVNGLRGLLTGLRFPVANGYMTLQTLASEGAEIGTITLGGQHFSLQFVPDRSPLVWESSTPCLREAR